ncbi:DUF3106 domain-containing protein [Aquimonas voraii]|uniref:DUF3106 domain-containing protein n=1 Tax=Aquimonas voraii TaxID=265719 RepID=A0A1G7AFA9_9GAMM|nr:DUF3106 domain-containing protein [Aquimonas voraii]SDE13450.1 Protein of unknown function [Aquimonas voraii]
MPDSAAARSSALLRAWLLAEGLPPAAARRVRDFAQGLTLLQSQPGTRGHPEFDAAASWLRLWAGLPAGARDLLALRVLGGLALERVAELQGRPLARLEREWLLLGRRLAAKSPAWPADLRAAFLSLQPELAPPRRALRVGFGLAALACFAGAAFAPQLHYAFLLDPAQQRLQAPPAAPPPVVEQVPLSASEFELWADAVEFATLERLDFLLWRLQAGGGEVVAAAGPAAPPESLDTVPADLDALTPWAESWPRLQPAQRAELWARARRWEALGEPERLRFEQRAAAYRSLPPLQRADLRERHARWAGFDAATQSTLRALEAGLASATAEEQSTLRAQFEALPEAVRRGLLAGKTPELAELAREAFAFVPEEEREATVELLRGLGETEHGLLRRMARRLDPAAREALRAELLAAEPPARAALVRDRAAAVGVRAD